MISHYKNYRLSVGIVLFNSDGLVWIGNRIGLKNAWQFPQGGLNKSEIPIPSVIKISGPMELGLVILRFAEIKLKFEIKVIFLKK